MPLTIYLAYPFSELASARIVAETLRNAGYLVSSLFLADGLAEAERDSAAVNDSDVLVLLNHMSLQDAGSEDRHVEFGLALGFGVSVIVWGPITNRYHGLARVRQVTTESELLAEVRSLAAVSAS